MTAPLTFSSVDSKRANAGVLRSKPAERDATEDALGSCNGAVISIAKQLKGSQCRRAAGRQQHLQHAKAVSRTL